MRSRAWLAAIALLGAAALGPTPAAQQSPGGPSAARAALTPTAHPRLPADPAHFWMVPTEADRRATAALAPLATAIRLETEGQSDRALPLLAGLPLRDHPLAHYIQHYKGLVELSLGRAEDALRTFQQVTAATPVGVLAELAPLREAESYEGLGSHALALRIYERLSSTATNAPDDVLMRVGRSAEASGDMAKALEAFSRVYYDFPLSDLAPAARLALEQLPDFPSSPGDPKRFARELRRAERLFAARRYTDARTAFDGLRSAARGDEADLIGLRIAQSDYHLRRFRVAREALEAHTGKSPRRAEAIYFHAVASYELGDRIRYFLAVDRLREQFAADPWTEEALNHLASHYIREDQDDDADETFREMLAAFPSGRFAERAAWRIGWWAYRHQRYEEAIRFFEGGAARFPRSDYRPSWLYWSARAYEALENRTQAQAWYRLAATDYFSSYYGRLALSRLDGVRARRELVAEAEAKAAARLEGLTGEGDEDPFPPTRPVIQALLELGLYEQAVKELQYAQKKWGDSPALQATLAWAYRRQGEREPGGQPQFTLYRNAINTMKRAYPHYLAVSGERLPDEILRAIYPLEYWDLIRRHAQANGLDPYFVAALVAQESTFVRDIRSAANAVGLMQLLPSTARRMAGALNIRYSSALLTTPEANIRLGTAYLAQHFKEFGQPHLVLASYNAGERIVRTWVAERPGLPQDEFIDDIPYPETQNYVKRILGTAEDYRRLYREQ
jgi:soluble lytic murein transglycosylase